MDKNNIIQYTPTHFANCNVCEQPLHVGEEYIDLSVYRCQIHKAAPGQEHKFETSVKSASSVLIVCMACSEKIRFDELELRRTIVKSKDGRPELTTVPKINIEEEPE